MNLTHSSPPAAMRASVRVTSYSGAAIHSADGKSSGTLKGISHHRCRLEGCTGQRVHAAWNDGSRTYPCTKGLTLVSPGVFKVG